MKKIHLLAAMVATFSLVACSSEDQGQTAQTEKNLVIRLAGINEQARATAPGELVTSQTQNINGVLIFLTDASNNTSAIRGVTKSADPASEWAQLTNSQAGGGIKIINVEKNTSKVYVFANAETANLYSTESPIPMLATTLPLQQNGSHVLYRGVDEDLRPVVTEPVNPDPTLGQTYTAQISIKPIVARIQIKSVSFQPSGTTTVTKTVGGTPQTATVTWSNFAGTLKGVYLNNFYYDYTFANNASTLMHNTFYDGTIQGGTWMFDGNNAASYASYSNYTTAYQDLPLNPGATSQCYGFNFFPGTEIPTIHLDVNAAVADPATDITSDNDEIFNPYLTGMRFANITKYFKDGNQMTSADFKAGYIYNMDVVLTPVLDVDISSVQYNVLVNVTVEPWIEQTITPGFDYQN